MILVDSSVWIDHLRRTNDRLVVLLEDVAVAIHPFVIGELALGSLRERTNVISALSDLPTVIEAGHDEVLGLIERRSLFARGLGYVDVHLLASTLLTGGTKLWTLDKRLAAVADELGIGVGKAMN